MSASQLYRQVQSGRKGGQTGSQASAGSTTEAIDQEAGFGNSWLAQALLEEAAKDVGGGGEDWAIGLSEDPEKYVFAEDGDDVGGQTGERKQQKEGLPALRPTHENSQWEDFQGGKAFVQDEKDKHAVDPNDVAQGSLGDCYLIAGMAAVARANPEAIKKLIKDNGDGTFDVTLYIRSSAYGRPRAVTKTVDARLAVKSAGRPLYAGTGDKKGDDVELWTALIEKTLAQHKQSYDLISGGNINGNGFNFAGATELLTGEYESYQRIDTLDDDEILLNIAIALDDRKPITVDSRNIEGDEALTREANKANVYWNHAYAPQSVDLDGRTISLQNPWGSHHVTDLKVEDFKRYYKAIRVGGGA